MCDRVRDLTRREKGNREDRRQGGRGGEKGEVRDDEDDDENENENEDDDDDDGRAHTRAPPHRAMFHQREVGVKQPSNSRGGAYSQP